MADESKKYGAQGGKARAKNLTKEQLSEIGRRGALTRWVNEGSLKIIPAIYGASDRPMRIGDVELPCYVLADERRVFSQRGLQAALGLSEGGGKGGARKIA